MKKLFFMPALALFVMTLAPAPVPADMITVQNGDRITGEITMISRGKIHIVTQYAGEIQADLAGVTGMSTEKDGRITMSNGDTISGRIRSVAEDGITIESPALKTVVIARELFAGFNEPPTEASARQMEQENQQIEQLQNELRTTQEKLAAKEEQVEEFTSISKLWSGSFSVGAQLSRGNTDSSDVRVDIRADRKMPREQLLLRFFSEYGETSGDTDTNEVFGEAKLKVFQSDRFYLFGLTNMEYDEMENLDLRAQIFGGPGYTFIDNENTRLLGEIGAGITGEFFDEDEAGSDEETVEGSLLLNAEWTQKLFKNAEFFQGLTVYPGLGDFGDYRLRSESTITTPLGDQWAVKLSLIDDYDSDPESEDVKRNDLQLISAIEYKY